MILFRKFLLFTFSSIIITLAYAKLEEYEIKIINHKFVPETIYASAGSAIKLRIINTDPTVEEFESFDLKREKIVPGNGGKIVVKVGPLKPGTYSFFGEFNQATAQGKIIVN